MPTFEKPNEQGFREWWLREGYHHMPGAGEPPEHAAIAELAWNAALQSVPSSPGHGKPITEREIESWAAAPSDAGQPVEWPECYDFYQLMQIYRHMPVERVADVRAAYEAVKEWLRSVAAPPALEKLRELETTWIARSEMTPSCRNCSLEQCAYEMCADELHDVLTELEPKAPPPRTGQEEQD